MKALIERLEGEGRAVLCIFLQALPTFSIPQDLLYKENFSVNNTAWLLMISSSLGEEIFHACHDDLTAGQLGYSKTIARIREMYYWPKLAITAHHYTRSCHDCEQRYDLLSDVVSLREKLLFVGSQPLAPMVACWLSTLN